MAPPEHPSPAAPSENSQPPPPAASAAAKGKGQKKDDDDLSEEDLALKEQLELYVVRAQDADPGVQKLALESMRQEIRSATSSMTSVPKPLKFLRPHYGTLKSYFETMPESELKKYMADILSVLALTMSVEGERESLKFRLLGSEGDIGSWGHEYVRNLAGEIAQEFQKHQKDQPQIKKQDSTTGRSTPKKDMVTLSSGSDASPGNSPSRAGDANHEEDSLSTPRRKGVQQTKNKKVKVAETKSDPDQLVDTLEHQEGVADDEMQDKLTGNSVSQRLPLIFPDKVQRSKALIECDGDSIDLSGDIGAVGRIVVSNGPTGSQDLLLDLKGTIYKTTIVPSRTFCVVSVGQSEAKIEAIMNDFIQLEQQSNLFEAETMMEGTLDGFTFDSDEEGDKLPESQPYQNDQNNEDDGQPKAKTKRKSEKQVGKAPKKAKVARKAPKKGTKKTQPAKRTRKANK